MHEGGEKQIKISFGIPEVKRPIQESRHRWEDKFFTRKLEFEDMFWIHLTSDRIQWLALVNRQ